MATTNTNYPFVILNTELAMGRQNVILTQLLSCKAGECKLRIIINSDAYKFQSYAKIEIWNQGEVVWKELGHIHYSLMNTPSSMSSEFMSYEMFNARKQATLTKFDADVKELQRMALLILS